MKKLILLFLTPLLFSCGGGNKEDGGEKIPTHSYSEVKDKTIDFLDTFKQKENHYYVYCYSTVCKYCEDIKNEVIHIALKNVKVIYFTHNARTEDIDPSATIGTTDIEDLFVRGFPSLIEINNASVKDNILGKNKVIETLRK